MNKIKFVNVLTMILLTLVFASQSFAYNTIGVRVDPYNFFEEKIIEISWKADILEFEYNSEDYSNWRLEFNSLNFQGANGGISAGAWIQNILHQYEEASCAVGSMPGGLELYFTSMDQNMMDDDPTNDIIIGVNLDADPNEFPRFRRVYQDIDGTGIVGNNIYSNDEIIKPNKANPPTIEWNVRRGSLITNPSGNLHKNINCEWQQLQGDYREWIFSVKVNGANYPVGTFYLPEEYGSYLNSASPFIFLQEHFGSCGSNLHINKARVEYYDFQLLTESSSEPIPIPEWRIGHRIDDECGNNDPRYGVGTVVKNNKKRLVTSVGHEEDINLKRDVGFIFEDIDENLDLNPDSDLDSNGIVDGSDLTIFAFSFGKSTADGDFVLWDRSDADKSDLNDDGVVDGSDLTVFAFDFGEEIGEYFTVSADNEDFIILVTDPQTVQNARDNYYGMNSLIVTGDLVDGDGGFNQPWSWHLNPDSVRMVETAMELCDGSPSDVENDLDYWLNTVGVYCPWDSVIKGCPSCELTANTKDMTQYANKEIFLISDSNWKDILSLVPAAIWAEGSEIKKYPVLIYHEEDSGFDADSAIYFMQQYSPDRVTIIGSTPQELDNLMIAAPELGAGLAQDQIQRISADNYLSYWQSYENIVLVEDNYELALLASTYASLINAPMVIEGTNYGNALYGKTVICVGNPSGAACDEQYSLEQLQQKYLELTNTDKIILANPNDLTIMAMDDFIPEKSPNAITNLYSKTSLIAPLLASAKKELILTAIETNYEDIDQFIENKITSLGINPNYLTITATPDAIKNTWIGAIEYYGRYLEADADTFYYSNIDDDIFVDLAVGRIYSLTPSDTSSYIARVLFYDEIPKSNSFDMLYNHAEFPDMKRDAKANDKLLTAAGFNSESVFTDEEFPLDTSRDMNDRFYINYLDHGWSEGWVGIYTSTLENEKVWLSPSVITSEACSTCSYNQAYNKDKLFCSNVIRRGALAHIGAVDIAWSSDSPSKIFLETLLNNKPIGEAIKSYKNSKYLDAVQSSGLWDIFNNFNLIGDPTFNLELNYPDIEKIEVSSESSGAEKIIQINIPKTEKTISFQGDDYSLEMFESYPGKENYYFGKHSSSWDSNYANYIILTDVDEGYGIIDVEKVELVQKDGTVISLAPGEGSEGCNQELINFLLDQGQILERCRKFRFSGDNINTEITLLKDNEGAYRLFLSEYMYNSDFSSGVIDEYSYKIYLELEDISENPRCWDLTRYDECSEMKPLFCDNGNLIDKCSSCGCGELSICLDDETCKSSGLTKVYNDYATDSNGNGKYDYLAFDAGLDIAKSGEYKTNAYLRTSFGDSISSAFDQDTLDEGEHTATLLFNGMAIYESGYNGPYKIDNIALYDSNWKEIDEDEEDYTTNSYKFSDFDAPPDFTNNYNDYGSDIDADGKYEYLTIEAEVEISLEGTYTVCGDLLENSGEWEWIAGYCKETSLGEGSHTVQLDMSGYYINKKEIDGPYKFIANIQKEGYYKQGDEYITASYNHGDFE